MLSQRASTYGTKHYHDRNRVSATVPPSEQSEGERGEHRNLHVSVVKSEMKCQSD